MGISTRRSIRSGRWSGHYRSKRSRIAQVGMPELTRRNGPPHPLQRQGKAWVKRHEGHRARLMPLGMMAATHSDKIKLCVRPAGSATANVARVAWAPPAHRTRLRVISVEQRPIGNSLGLEETQFSNPSFVPCRARPERRHERRPSRLGHFAALRYTRRNRPHRLRSCPCSNRR